MHRITIASPCQESWEAMEGGDRVRSCERCQHKVYNLSEMTSAEVTALLERAEGRLCVRFYRRADGTVMTSDCPVGTGAKRQKQLQRVAATTAGVAAAVASASALLRGTPLPMAPTDPIPVVESTLATPEPVVEPHETMGKVAMGWVAPSVHRTTPSDAVMGEVASER